MWAWKLPIDPDCDWWRSSCLDPDVSYYYYEAAWFHIVPPSSLQACPVIWTLVCPWLPSLSCFPCLGAVEMEPWLVRLLPYQLCYLPWLLSLLSPDMQNCRMWVYNILSCWCLSSLFFPFPSRKLSVAVGRTTTSIILAFVPQESHG